MRVWLGKRAVKWYCRGARCELRLKADRLLGVNEVL
jgi:hypothetical protein